MIFCVCLAVVSLVLVGVADFSCLFSFEVIVASS